MAFSKNARTDSRRSASSYCSTVTMVVFVALCLVGVWMMTSSSVVPVQNVDLPAQEESKTEMKQEVIDTETQQFDDGPGNLPEDATRGDTNTDSNTNTDVQEDQQVSLQTTENSSEENQEGKPGDDKINSDGTSKTESENDRNGKGEGEEFKGENGESNSEDGESKTIGGEMNANGQVESDESSGDNKSESGETEKKTESEGSSDDKKNELEETQKKSESEESSDDNKSESGETQKKSESEESSDDKKSELWETQKKSESEESSDDKKSESETQKKSELEESSGETKQDSKDEGQIEESREKPSGSYGDSNTDGQAKDQASNEVFPDAAQSEILNETTTQNGVWSTQATESKNEKVAQQSVGSKEDGSYAYSWKVCNVTAGQDYIPCLDNLQAIKSLRSTKHYEHRERHCPEEAPTCLVSLPEGYKRSIEWPKSREKIWYYNVPHTKLAEVKGHQNWVKVSGEYLAFPGGGTQFKYGALHYIEFIQDAVSDIAWGKRTRVILDVGCGVASFGGYLFDKDVLTMSFAPKDEHEAQVQFALERGIPAISAVMGTKRLPFPGRVFDLVHCARCRVPWHVEGGKLLLELNRVLRPGGYFVWSATPVYQRLEEDVEIWKAMSELTKKMCWELLVIKNDTVDKVGAAIYRKPLSNECYNKRPENEPPLCQESDDPNAAWNVPLQACMHKLPVDASERGSQLPEQWPERVEKSPYWLKSSQVGVYGKPAPEDFTVDYEHWKRVVTKSYLTGMGINWSTVRNVMDMRSVYGGFAAALKDLNMWVMNVVTIDSPDTLPIIYERGMFGIYHDWCESFSTYPRSYDLLHADHIFSKLKKRCNIVAVFAEVDRILRPEGKLIVRDNVETIGEVESMARSLQWEIRLTFSKNNESLLCVQKSMWRPKEVETIISAIA